MMQIKPWTGAEFGYMLLMWVIMMVGMMVPSAVPMALIYAAIARKAARQGTTLAPTAFFVSGYIVIWSVFSVVATLAQWGLDQAALLSPMMVLTSPGLGAGLLIVAGLYQMTPMKDACLRHCRSPAHFISQSWKAGCVRCVSDGARAWGLLSRLLLDSHGAALLRRRDESVVDCRNHSVRAVGEGPAVGALMVVAGIANNIACQVTMGRSYSSFLVTREDHQLITRGMYAVRAPPDLPRGYLRPSLASDCSPRACWGSSCCGA